MATIHKFFELFRNLKSDAVPRPPRPSKETYTNPEPEYEHNENIDSNNEPEEIIIESDDEDTPKKSKPKFKKSFFKPGKNSDKSDKKSKQSNSTVNTQATGNVINVVNSKNVRWGNDYYMGPTLMKPQPQQFANGDDSETEVEEVKKSNDIRLVMEAKIKPEHEYIDHISKNLGKKWQHIFIKLGYTKNRIETMIIDTEKYGVAEARYKLLLDWINNEEDPSLGRLATHLWNEGQRPLVRDLALMYEKNIKNTF